MFKRFWLLPLMAMLLAACGTTPASNGGNNEMPALSVSIEGLTKGEGFIIRRENDKVLVNDTYFTIDGDTYVVSLGPEGEEELSIDDLEAGMKVDVYHSGMMLKSFPGQGYADVFVVKTDERSILEAEAFKAFLEKENIPDLVILGQINYEEDTILFNFTDLSNDLSYHVKLDIETKDYTIETHTQ